ncbi:MAG: C13 family peptidase [Gammaproteobacteria bacterium]
MSAPAPHLAAELAANLAAGWQLALGRRPQLSAIHDSPRAVVATLTAYWIVVMLAAKLGAGATSTFWNWGLAAELAHFQAWLLALLVACWAARALHDAARLGVVLLNAAIPVALVSGGGALLVETVTGAHAGGSEDFRHAATLAWLLLIFLRALALLPRTPWPRALAAAASYASGLAAIALLLPRADLFYRPQPVPPAIDVEAVYYHQAALLDDALANLTAPVLGQVDVYFLAVAPFAGQDVFLREVRAAENIVEQRLGLRGHTLALVNHPDTRDTLPLANVPNLTRALARLGTMIDRDEDIVFVYLTSHGDEDATLAADFAGIAPNDIHAHELRAALDDAGIRWRVVVISACYSGSFVAPLRSPDTLLLTAAAADRSSFGCSHENAWTYFGEAFFAEALAQTTDLVQAARLASAAIARREADEGLPPSQPQIVPGARIGAQLARWQAELEANPPVAP